MKKYKLCRNMPYKNSIVKRILSFIVALIMVVTGFIMVKLCKPLVSGGKNKSISGELTPSPYDKLQLTKDFNIDDENAVKERAQAIYDISEKEISLEDIINIIYITNGKEDKIKLPESDVDKFKYLQNVILKYQNLLGDNIQNYAATMTDTSITSEDKVFIEDKEFIFAYMTMATTDEGKKASLEVAKGFKEQKDNIINATTDKYPETARKVYDTIKTVLENDKINTNEKSAIILDVISKEVFIAKYLTPEQQEDLKTNFQNFDLNITFFEIAKKLDLIKAQDEIIESGETVKNTPTGTNKNDESDAKKYAGPEKKLDEPVVINEGGKQDGTVTEKVTEKSPESTTHTNIVTEPANNIPSKTETYVIPGGQVIGETEVRETGEFIGTETYTVLAEIYVDEAHANEITVKTAKTK